MIAVIIILFIVIIMTLYWLAHKIFVYAKQVSGLVWLISKSMEDV